MVFFFPSEPKPKKAPLALKLPVIEKKSKITFLITILINSARKSHKLLYDPRKLFDYRISIGG